MDEMNMAANADVETSEGIANPQSETSTESTNEVQVSAEKEDVTQTQSFSKRLKEETSKVQQKYDSFAQKLGYSSFTELENTYAEQEKQAYEQQLREQGKDPEVEKLKEEVESMKHEKKLTQQAETMSKDPKNGELFKQWRTEIDSKLAELRQMGVKNADYDLAFTLLSKEKISELMTNKEELKKQAIKEYLDSVKQGQKPVEGSGSTPTIVTSSPKTFADARSQAMQFLKQSKEFK